MAQVLDFELRIWNCYGVAIRSKLRISVLQRFMEWGNNLISGILKTVLLDQFLPEHKINV